MNRINFEMNLFQMILMQTLKTFANNSIDKSMKLNITVPCHNGIEKGPG